MTILDMKKFLEKFDDKEEIADVEFVVIYDKCNECEHYEYCEEFDYARDCTNNGNKDNTKILSIAFKSDIDENGYISGKDFHELKIRET